MHTADCDSSDSDMDDIDIENMLDEGLPEDLRDHKKQQHYEEKYKTILDGNYLQWDLFSSRISNKFQNFFRERT